MEPLERIERATGHLAKVAEGVKPDDLAKSTPCSEFDVRGLLNHLFGGLEMLTVGAETGDATQVDLSKDRVSDDVGNQYAQAREKLLAAWNQPGVLEKPLKMPFGEMPGAMMAGIAFFEHLTHAWDLAKATGQDAELPEDLAAECLEAITPMDAMFRMPGVCGPKVEVPDDASISDKLVAFAGRRP